MFKLVVGALLVSFACAAPGIVGHYPGAVSHVSRVDVHDSKPIIAGYGAPYGYESVGAYAPYPVGHYGGYASGGYAPGGYAPGGYASGGYAAGHYGYPAAHSYSNRIDVHSAAVPVVTPALGYGHGYGQGYGLGYGHGNGYGIHDGSGYGYPVHGYGIQGLHHGY